VSSLWDSKAGSCHRVPSSDFETGDFPSGASSRVAIEMFWKVQDALLGSERDGFALT
jgi:hypothetical protein